MLILLAVLVLQPLHLVFHHGRVYFCQNRPCQHGRTSMHRLTAYPSAATPVLPNTPAPPATAVFGGPAQPLASSSYANAAITTQSTPSSKAMHAQRTTASETFMITYLNPFRPATFGAPAAQPTPGLYVASARPAHSALSALHSVSDTVLCSTRFGSGQVQPSFGTVFAPGMCCTAIAYQILAHGNTYRLYPQQPMRSAARLHRYGGHAPRM